MALELVDAPARRTPLMLDLWLWSIEDVPVSHRASLAAHLDPVERGRASRFVTDALRARFETGRGRMREILAGYIGCAPQSVPLVTGVHGKPHIADDAFREAPSFNLAHAGGWAALVIGPSGLPLGIDIEPQRAVEPALAERYFSAAERAELATLPDDLWSVGFFNAWTRKEALLKAIGAGLTRPLDSFDVTLTPGQPARLLRLSGAVAERWQLVPLDLAPAFPGCVALRSQSPVEIVVREGELPLP